MKPSMQIPRIFPETYPPIRPIWEYQACGALKASYEDYKNVMQVPWVGVVTLAYAQYRAFFDRWWHALRPICETQAYVEVSRALREATEARIAALDPPLLSERLLAMGYSARELGQIQDMIEVISHGNFAQIPAVFSARLLLEGGTFSGGSRVGELAERHDTNIKTPFILVEPHHVLGDVGSIYEDIKNTLNLPMVNTDYRCLARWPSYFQLAWTDLLPRIDAPEYEEVVQATHTEIFDAIAGLPNPEGITSGVIKDAAQKDASVEEVLNTTRLFTWLIPGLVTNVAFFRAQLL